MAESKKRRAADPPPEEPEAAAMESSPVEAEAGDEQPAAGMFFTEAVSSNEQTIQLIGRLTEIAQPGVIFSAPLKVDDRVIFTASELMMGLGAGFAAGGGTDPEHPGASGSGGGGGGGGYSFGRPVAVVSVGPQGVKVEPVVDVTKIVITFFTAFGAMFLALRSMRRFGKE
jgi:uncharacterized spore protein YtfJ